MYSGKFSRLVEFGSFSMSCCSLSLLSIGCSLCINDMSWCCILHSFGHLLNYIVLVFQFTSGLCLTNQSYSRNMSVLFKSITAASICSVCPFISSSSSANHVTSSFLVLSVLKTLKYLFIGSILILSSFTNCLSIPVWVQPESTSIFSYSSFSFDI